MDGEGVGVAKDRTQPAVVNSGLGGVAAECGWLASRVRPAAAR